VSFLEVSYAQLSNILETNMLFLLTWLMLPNILYMYNGSHLCFNFESYNCRMEMVGPGHRILDLGPQSQLGLGISLTQPLIYPLIQ
jgi:hypothetical protein